MLLKQYQCSFASKFHVVSLHPLCLLLEFHWLMPKNQNYLPNNSIHTLLKSKSTIIFPIFFSSHWAYSITIINNLACSPYICIHHHFELFADLFQDQFVVKLAVSFISDYLWYYFCVCIWLLFINHEISTFFISWPLEYLSEYFYIYHLI